MPADTTLGDLHPVIQDVMGWDDDHLHAFTVGSTRYGDPEFDMADEHGVTIGEVFTRYRTTIGYTYDFGADWQHAVTLEEALDAGTPHPVRVEGSGSVPVEGLEEWT